MREEESWKKKGVRICVGGLNSLELCGFSDKPGLVVIYTLRCQCVFFVHFGRVVTINYV